MVGPLISAKSKVHCMYVCDAFLTSVQISVTAEVIFDGWNGSIFFTNRGFPFDIRGYHD